MPGPLEASRRLGKRRMAHMAEMPSTVAGRLGFGLWSSWWSSIWEKDLTKWQWEPPRTKSADLSEPAQDLPPWLIRWDSVTNTEEAATLSEEITKAKEIKSQEAIAVAGEITKAAETMTHDRITSCDDIDAFVASLELMPDNVSHACDVFTHRLKRSLILEWGSEPAFESIIGNILTKVPDAIRQANIDIVEAQILCLNLYQSIWDGLEASEFTSPRLIGRRMTSLLLKMVLDVPISDGVWLLVARIITGSSRSQRRDMMSALPRVTLIWLQYNMNRSPGANFQGLLQATEALRISEQRLDFLQDILQYQHTEGESISQAVRQAREAMRLALSKIQLLESPADHWVPDMPSIINILLELSVPQVKASMESCMDLISESSFTDDEKLDRSIQRTLRNNLLLLVARMPCLDDDFLIYMLKQKKEMYTIPLLGSLIVEHWLSQKKIDDDSMVRVQLKIEGDLGIRQQDLGTILVAMYAHNPGFWEKTAFIWKLCDELERPWVAFHTLKRIRQAKLRFPQHLVTDLVNRISKHDARLALQIHSWYHFTTDENFARRLPRRGIEVFVIAMVNEKRVEPRDIWRVLKINTHREPLSNDNTLDIRRIPVIKEVELLDAMADAFAKCPKRPPRVAFRGAMECLFQVRKHKAPITPKLCRAVVYAGATRYIEANLWIPPGRLRWLMGLINFIEGEEVAIKVVDAVTYWNSSTEARQDWEKRDRDPLKLGSGL